MPTSRVLIVDDEPSLVEFLSLLCTAEGYDVSQALSVAEALARIDRVVAG